MMRRNLLQDKKGGMTDLFIFMIIGFVLVVILGVMMYIGNETAKQLHESMDDMDIGDGRGNNASAVIDQTIGVTNGSFKAFYWISVMLLFGMIIAIWISAYMVTTKPIFFIPYIFLVIIAVIVSVAMSNAYGMIIVDDTLSSTFAGFTGANWFMNNLPMVITIVGFIGGIIMFSRMGSREENVYNGY